MVGLKIAYVPGVTPGKWLTRWNERYPQTPLTALRYDSEGILDRLGGGESDVVFVRFPTGHSPKTPAIHVIPLYEEQPVVCGAKESDLELFDEPLTMDDLAGQTFLELSEYPQDVGGIAMAMEVCSSGAGLLRLPLSVARLHHRKDVIHKELSDVPTTSIGIAWLAPQGDDPADPVIDEFIGVVRGRGANSSRQASVAQKQQEEAEVARKRRQSAQSEQAKAAKKAEAKKKTATRHGKRPAAKRNGRR